MSMRDYSFGNFISALRQRRGLSQYQLGALVGLTDKAVSKWENGVAKPRINTIRKLSEVLDVSVDELLTCEYVTFKEKRKDLFAMKNEIIIKAEYKMRELYGEYPPARIINRFMSEKMMLDKQDALLWMGFMGELYDRFQEENVYFEVRGAGMGASFMAWLLGGTNVNPMAPHYYCQKCKRVEFITDKKFSCGIDLPDKICCCGNKYIKDGFGIDAMNIYPFSNWNEIYVTRNVEEMIKSILKEYFKEYGIVFELKITYEKDLDEPTVDRLAATRYVILPKDEADLYQTGEISLSIEEYFHKAAKWTMLIIARDEENPIQNSDLKDIDFTSEEIKAYFRHMIEKGKYDKYDSEKNLKKVYSNIENPTFAELIAIQGILCSTGVWNDYIEELYDNGLKLSELITCREDLYDYLYDKINSKCCDNPSGLAFKIKDDIRKGKYGYNRMPLEVENLLLQCDIPKWRIESIKRMLYLFPKTFIITRLKGDICRMLKSK